METISFTGYELIINNEEIKQKSKEVIDRISEFIPEERKTRILEKLI